MFNEVAVVSHNAWNQDFSVRKFYLFPDAPLMLMTRIRRFDRVSAGADLQNYVHDISERNIVFVGTMITAPAHMKPHAILWQVSQAVVKRVDAPLLIFSIFSH